MHVTQLDRLTTLTVWEDWALCGLTHKYLDNQWHQYFPNVHFRKGIFWTPFSKGYFPRVNFPKVIFQEWFFQKWFSKRFFLTVGDSLYYLYYIIKFSQIKAFLENETRFNRPLVNFICHVVLMMISERKAIEIYYLPLSKGLLAVPLMIIWEIFIHVEYNVLIEVTSKLSELWVMLLNNLHNLQKSEFSPWNRQCCIFDLYIYKVYLKKMSHMCLSWSELESSLNM